MICCRCRKNNAESSYYCMFCGAPLRPVNIKQYPVEQKTAKNYRIVSRHNAAWWIFIGWWWVPCKLIVYFIPRLIIESAVEHSRKKTPQKVPQKAPLQRAVRINVDLLSPIEYENYVAHVMRARGFVNVQTTRTSGDYGADILMTARNGTRICIQCKRYHGAVGYKAVQEIFSAKAFYGCHEAWVCTTHGYTKNAQEGAKRLGVKLYVIR